MKRLVHVRSNQRALVTVGEPPKDPAEKLELTISATVEVILVLGEKDYRLKKGKIYGEPTLETVRFECDSARALELMQALGSVAAVARALEQHYPPPAPPPGEQTELPLGDQQQTVPAQETP